MKKLLPIVMLISILVDENSLQAQWVQTNGAAGNYIRCFAVSDINLFAGANVLGEGVFLSTNNGTSWTAVDSGLINLETEIPAVNALAISGQIFSPVLRAAFSVLPTTAKRGLRLMQA